MIIKSLSVKGYRNLEIPHQALLSGINILQGNNAQGKTNCLEAIYFCAFGRSLRARGDGELIQWGETTSHIRLELERGGIPYTLDAMLESQGKKTIKSLSMDKVPIRHMKDLFGRLLVVMFSPEDLRLIKAGPSERRRFMDMEICQLSPVYYSDLKEYHRALKQRNALLKTKPDKISLEIWDEQLVNFGQRIIKTRTNFIKKINIIAAEIHNNITQGAEALYLEYKPGINPEAYAETLKKSHDKDIYRGSTSEGIHTDDIDFTINGISVRHFGSQGQQRTAALSSKLAEISIIKQAANETPILLLDDVLSELDAHRQKFLFSQITDLQTIITCTGVEDFLKTNIHSHILNVEGGKIKGLKTKT
ncbi:MAG: DNA replication/repair protein RecF [Defluviitaleaceae bacterium]|nr:DNA replication/repair protein RecF [Defluviitaleaceae bacterium]